MSKTAKAMAIAPGLLGRDWQARVSPAVLRELRGARSLRFVGTGTSYHCALWSRWLAAFHGVHATAQSTWDFLAESAAGIRMDDGEACVLISHRGGKTLTREAMRRIGKNRIVLIAGERAPAGRHPVIFASPAETSAAHTMSLVGAMGAASELVASLLDARRANSLRQARGDTARFFLANLSPGKPLPELPRRAGLHFIGGGPFEAMAREAALKAREMAHIPAHAYGSEEFLHGPLASVEGGDVAILLGPARIPATGLTGKIHWERLESCRAALRAIRAKVVDAPLPRAPGIADLGLCWQAAIALAWCQAFCLRLAEERGVNPDVNRRDDPRYNRVWRLIV